TRLPLAVASKIAAPAPSPVSAQQTVALEVRGLPGSEIYLNNAYRGRIRPDGVLILDGLSSGNQEISVDYSGAETLKQTVALTTAKTILDLNAVLPAPTAAKSSPLVPQIKEALAKGKVLEPGGAWPLYQQLVRQAPEDPQRVSIEVAMTGALDELGQQ